MADLLGKLTELMFCEFYLAFPGTSWRPKLKVEEVFFYALMAVAVTAAVLGVMPLLLFL